MEATAAGWGGGRCAIAVVRRRRPCRNKCDN